MLIVMFRLSVVGLKVVGLCVVFCKFFKCSCMFVMIDCVCLVGIIWLFWCMNSGLLKCVCSWLSVCVMVGCVRCSVWVVVLMLLCM